MMGDIEKLASEYPQWRFWWSRREGDRQGELMATRRRDLTDEEMHAGLAATLPMGFGADLREQLDEQASRERAFGQGG